jgi:hypothetical protein
MGVAIYDSEGTLLRPGADRGAGELRLIEAEVRGFIAMTEEDLANAGESAGPISIADLHRGLATSLPVGYSVEDFAAAYAEAYAAEPASLAAQVMLGQPIEPETRLLRIQMWLLLVDGFVSPGETGIGRSPVLAAVSRPSSVGTVVARLPAGATLGAAARFQPPLTSPMAGVSNTDWARVLARLPFLAYGVPFVVEGDGILIHEGHGRLGHNLQLTARFLRPRDLEQGRLLVRAKDIGCCLTITWDTSHESVLRDHGEVVGSLFTPMLTDDSGAVSIGYQAKEEVENRQNFSFSEYATLYPRVDQLALVIRAFDLPVEIFEVIRTESLITGTRVADSRGFGIGWHDEGFWQVEIVWTDVHDGVHDTVTFEGIIDTIESSDASLFSGVGTATGSRPGYTACNPGFDYVPSGSGPAEFYGVVVDDTITISAFAGLYNVLSGVTTAPFEVDIAGGTATYGNPPVPGASPSGSPSPSPGSSAAPSGTPYGDLCPRYSFGTIKVTAAETP